MRYSKVFIRSVLLLTIPSLALYPQADVPAIPTDAHETETAQGQLRNDHLLSYDDILNLIDDLEDGELEKRCSQADLERINHFLTNLAKQGVLPNEPEEEFNLESDVQELLNEEDNPYEYSFSFDRGGNGVIVPAVAYGQGEVVLCRSWVKKKWDQTKKFVKKHKKAIIIGAAVVVAAAVVVCAVAVASTASIAAAGAAAASGSDKAEEKDKSKAKNERASAPSPSMPPTDSPLALAAVNETSLLKATLEEHISTFKEGVVEDNLSNSHEDLFFGEDIRNLGAILAHKTLEGVSQLASCVPQLLQEIKDIGQRIVPESLLPPNNGIEITPAENYEKLIAAGHEKIDEVFSTDQAEQYSSEAKEGRNKFTIGILPPPSMLGGIFANTNKLVEAGKAIDRAGFTRAGRALMKHGNREMSVFPKPVGNPAQMNEHGQKILESILNHPERKVVPGEFKRFGKVVDIYAPDIGGVRYSADGEFVGFLEP